MKRNNLKIYLLCIVLISITSCNNDPVTTIASPSSASLVSLTFTTNAISPNAEKAVFTIDTINGIVTNLDSLPYLTDIDSVIPTFKFKSSSGSYIYYGADSVALDGTDTLNFTVLVKIRNFSADNSNYKEYEIKVNVHTVESELYQWSIRNPIIHSGAISSQKAIVFNDSLFCFVNDGTTAYLYKSGDGSSWQSISITGLPVNSPLTDLTVFNNTLFLTQDGDKLYTATNPSSWSVYTLADYNFSSLLPALENKLWAVVQSKSDLTKFYFASSTTGSTWLVNTTSEIPSNFPLRNFAALSFSSRTNKAKVMLLGGISIQGDTLSTNWNTEDGLTWFDFSTENNDLQGLDANASVITYDNKLLLYSKGLSGNTQNQLYESKDEGFTWTMVDTTFNSLPTTDIHGLRHRTEQSMLVLKPRAYSSSDSKTIIEESNRIFILGGEKSGTPLTDCWTGKLNRKNFLIQ